MILAENDIDCVQGNEGETRHITNVSLYLPYIVYQLNSQPQALMLRLTNYPQAFNQDVANFCSRDIYCLT